MTVLAETAAASIVTAPDALVASSCAARPAVTEIDPPGPVAAMFAAPKASDNLSWAAPASVNAIGADAPLEVVRVTPAALPLSSDSASAAARARLPVAVAFCAEICAAPTSTLPPLADAVPSATRPPAVTPIPPAVAVSVAPGPAAVSATASPVTEPPLSTTTLPPLLLTEPIRTSPVAASMEVLPLSVSAPTRSPSPIAAGLAGARPVKSRATVEVMLPDVAALIRASVLLSICAAPPAVTAFRTRNSSRLTSARPLPSPSSLISVALVPAAPVPR